MTDSFSSKCEPWLYHYQGILPFQDVGTDKKNFDFLYIFQIFFVVLS